MAFPTTPLETRVDLQVGGVWTNVTSDVLGRDPITITRGRSDWASRADPAVCNLTFRNTAGKYSPRNPSSPYYGAIGRNTPIRVGIGTPPTGAGSTGLTGSSLVAPSVTAEAAGSVYCSWLAAPGGNVTVPVGFTASAERDGTLSTMRSGCKTVAAGATGTATATYSLASTAAAALSVTVPGTSSTAWSVNGTLAGETCSSLVTGLVAGYYLLAIYGWSADPDDRMGAVADNEGGCEWMLVADTGASAGPRMKAYIRRVRTAGSLTVAFYGDNFGTPDVYGTVWTLDQVVDYYPRYTGEVSAWPSKWDLSGRDVWVPVQASGILRRLGQGSAPLRSALYRQLVGHRGLVAYWPMEDADGSTVFANAITGGSPMARLGSPDLASYSDFQCSDPLPTFTAAGASGPVSAYTATGEFSVGALIHIPASGMLDESTILTVRCTGTARTWTIKYDTLTVGFHVEAFTEAGVSIENIAIGPWTPTLPDSRFFLYLSVAPSGADIAWSVRYVPIVAGSDFPATNTYSDSIVGQTIGAVTSVQVGAPLDLTGAPAIGHVVVASSSTTFFSGTLWRALVGWTGDTARGRILRLCGDESIPYNIEFGANSELIGPQRVGTLLDLLAECEVADDGVLYEPKGYLGIAYRSRYTKYNQTADVTLSYTGGNISEPFEPVDDDQGVINDVTVSRTGGSSARAVLSTGLMSTLPPPLGVGRYDTSIDLNLYADTQTGDQAGWRRHVGTWDEARWPTVIVDLARNPSLAASVAGLDIGDTVTLTNLPAWVPPGPTDLILEGYTETLGHPNTWEFKGNYSPAGPYRVGVYASSASRYSADLSVTFTTMTTTATSFQSASSGPMWITTASHPAEFPFDITVNGEQMTVTAIVGATSPQTFTVTRSVNGVVKSHATAEAIALARPARYAL